MIATEIRRHSEIILGADAPDMQRGVGVNPEYYKTRVPAKRKGTVMEIAEVAVFLASDGASYVTGQSIAVDGGWAVT